MAALEPLWSEQGWKLPNDRSWSLALCELLGPSLTLIKDGIDQAAPFFAEPPLEDDAVKQLEQEGARNALKALLSNLDASPWDGINRDEGQELLANAVKTAGVKKGVLMKSLRAALLGRLQGPDLMTTWGLLARLGADRQRIHRSV